MTAACHYAIVRFMPFVETGEFANVGVILFAPKDRFFGFKLQTKRHARITNFFNQLDGAVFRAVMRQAREELQRVAEELKPIGMDRRLKSFDQTAAMALWHELTKPLASVLRVSEPRILMTDNAQAKLNELFSFYVERDFVTKEYQEKILLRAVQGILRKVGKADDFHQMKIGDEGYSATFPLVNANAEDEPLKIIKPLSLVHADASQILDHGAAWQHRIRTLQRRELLPAPVLVAVEGRLEDDTRQAAARREVVEGFRELNVQVVPSTDEPAIEEFALRSA
ncbi:DUF3037 domain-containing protein [Pseudorhodoferax sp. Leaf265]|uniref:DUF3037 domain-containing protein n=1 Tax=Pseudorhodoferax sp. Leaf265 TaxID=1736315 RepID=UPI0006F9D859|nr:DUF3037 domain-containing protein [Pseudorhodoferax sp. Leaf265]KQP05331.1 hypothetical protein ASF45_12515 [Pseudorhodoferax sp. Leaf265]